MLVVCVLQDEHSDKLSAQRLISAANAGTMSMLARRENPGSKWARIMLHFRPPWRPTELPRSLSYNIKYVRKTLQEKTIPSCTYRPKKSPRFIFFGFIWSKNKIKSDTQQLATKRKNRSNQHTFGIFSRELSQLFRLRNDKLLEASILDEVWVIARYFTSLLGDFRAAMS